MTVNVAMAPAPTGDSALSSCVAGKSVATGPSGTEASAPVSYASIRDFHTKVELYRGKFSLICTATCKVTGRTVVIKGYNKAKMQPMNFVQYSKEVEIMQHAGAMAPYVVEYLDSFEDDRLCYIVMEHCPKGDLFKELLVTGGRMTERATVQKVIYPLLSVLARLHDEGYAHRDIKPENIFFAADGTLRLGDFGLAINVVKEKSNQRIGTLDYMAPEVVLMPDKDNNTPQEAPYEPLPYYDQAVDVWAVGVLTYELLSGSPPFETRSPEETAALIVWAEVDVFPVYVSKLSTDFMLQCLAKHPRARPTSKELMEHPWIQKFMKGIAKESPPPALHNKQATHSVLDLPQSSPARKPHALQHSHTQHALGSKREVVMEKRNLPQTGGPLRLDTKTAVPSSPLVLSPSSKPTAGSTSNTTSDMARPTHEPAPGEREPARTAMRPAAEPAQAPAQPATPVPAVRAPQIRNDSEEASPHAAQSRDALPPSPAAGTLQSKSSTPSTFQPGQSRLGPSRQTPESPTQNSTSPPAALELNASAPSRGEAATEPRPPSSGALKSPQVEPAPVLVQAAVQGAATPKASKMHAGGSQRTAAPPSRRGLFACLGCGRSNRLSAYREDGTGDDEVVSTAATPKTAGAGPHVSGVSSKSTQQLASQTSSSKFGTAHSSSIHLLAGLVPHNGSVDTSAHRLQSGTGTAHASQDQSRMLDPTQVRQSSQSSNLGLFKSLLRSITGGSALGSSHAMNSPTQGQAAAAASPHAGGTANASADAGPKVLSEGPSIAMPWQTGVAASLDSRAIHRPTASHQEQLRMRLENRTGGAETKRTMGYIKSRNRGH